MIARPLFLQTRILNLVYIAAQAVPVREGLAGGACIGLLLALHRLVMQVYYIALCARVGGRFLSCAEIILSPHSPSILVFGPWLTSPFQAQLRL